MFAGYRILTSRTHLRRDDVWQPRNNPLVVEPLIGTSQFRHITLKLFIDLIVFTSGVISPLSIRWTCCFLLLNPELDRCFVLLNPELDRLDVFYY